MLKPVKRLNLSKLITIFILLHLIQNVLTLHRQLTETELIQTFGVNKLEHVPEYNLINTFREHHSDGTVQKISFDAWNSTYIIELKKNEKLISPYLKSIIRNGDKTIKLNGLPTKNNNKNCHFFGKVVSHGEIKAAISDCKKLMGVVVHDDYFLVIQTLPHRLKSIEPKQHLVYKRSAALINPLENFVKKFDTIKKRKRRKADFKSYLNASNTNFPETKYYKEFDIISEKWLFNPKTENSVEEFCEISKSIDDVIASNKALRLDKTSIYNYTLSGEAQLDSLFIFPQLDPITLEIGLFLDSKLYEHFEREFFDDPDQHLTDFSLALINNVHILYQQPTLSPNIEIVIVHFELWKTQPSILATEFHKNGQAETLLDSFCRYQARINPGTDLTDPSHWDHAVLLTGYDIYHTTSSVAGVAPVGRMCDDIFGCSLVEGLHLGRSFVLAHEMGHNMGMVHDGVQNQCGRSCCLMSAVNGAGKTTWSTCSVREFNSFLLHLDDSGRGNCLRENTENIYSHDHLKDTRLPGQRFTADQQCSYFWGREYQVEIPNGRLYEDICRILWCGNSGSTISTAHPALEGSWCGGQKWCHEGRCEAWSYKHLPPPEIVHGEWSKWSNADTKCPITPCQITGSIALKSQLRTCTNPAPNNGGTPCKGVNVRGLLCTTAESFCKGYNRQEFGDRLCRSILNDAIRPDYQLSGTSFLHTTQPCKVWCHVQNSEMIRNKGLFPNGSPCGVNKYCVSGSCLSLSCNNKAVVANDSDCPPSDLNKKELKEEVWSEWSACSASCGDHGIQNRYRKCREPLDCEDKDLEIRLCNPKPPKCFQHSSWSKWSKCDAKCGSNVGKRKRKRFCVVGDCPSKSLFEEKSCVNVKPCKIAEWQEWSEWSTCSVTCGKGQVFRRRECVLIKKLNISKDNIENNIFQKNIKLKCEGEPTTIKSCNLELCSKEKEEKEKQTKNDVIFPRDQAFVSSKTDIQENWSEWTSCSVTCGIGFQLRERKCKGGKQCSEKGKQARTCNVQNCSDVLYNAIFSEWSLWSACSQTCGQGYQYRHRKCLNSLCSIDDVLSEHRRCVLGPCPNWGSWEIWLKECTSCNSLETRRRERKCLVMALIDGVEQETEVSQNNCLGLAYDLENCKDVCLNEQKTFKDNKIRLFASSIVFKNISSNTEEPNRLTMHFPWQEWSSCSVSCGQGVRQRKKSCVDEKNCLSLNNNIEFEICINLPCPSLTPTTFNHNQYWNEWTEWSHCPKNCNKYNKNRTRTCRIPLLFLCDGFSKEEKVCDSSSCVNSEVKIPEWSEWSDFSTCSCFTLTKFRRRYCKIYDPAVQGFCPGSVIDQKPCKPDLCVSVNGGWSKWSDWSQCSRDCGLNGHQIRNRMCSDPLPSNRGLHCLGHSFDQRRCNEVANTCSDKPIDGEWSQWTEWSSCSECINGQRSRTRYCSNPRPSYGGLQCVGSDFDLEACNNPELCYSSPVDGGFSEWTEWSNCSAECGFSFQSRQRYCDAPMKKNDGQHCKGLSYMTSICIKKPCHNFVDGQWTSWSDWSETNCFSTCDNLTGIRIRERNCSAPAPLSGGLLCFGPRIETFPCLNYNFNINAFEKNDTTCLYIKNLRLLETQTPDLTFV